MVNNVNAMFYATTYHPIQAGSIDGTDITAHDNGVYRALLASATGLYDPLGDPKVEGDPYCSLFVGRLSALTDENSLRQAMSKYGRVKNLRLVRHIVTGASCGYAFVEFESEKDMRVAYEEAHLSKLDGACILVDYNRQQLMSGWIPRRLGGGLGGKKESGQLRFGGRDRPFRAPLRPIPHEELRKLGIPLPPEGRYMTWFQVPPIPQRRQSTTSEYDGSSRTKQHRGEEYESTVKEKDEAEAEDARDRDRHRRRDEFSDRKHRIDPQSSKYEGYYEVEPKRPDSRDEQKRKRRKEQSLEYDDEDRKRHRSERRNRNLEYHTEQRDPDPEPSRSSRRNAEIDGRHRESRYRSENESDRKHRHGESKDESERKHRYGESKDGSEKKHRHDISKDESEKKHRHGESKDESEKKHRHGESKDESEKKHRHGESKDESEKKHWHGETKDESEKKHRHDESKDESEKKHRHGESKHRHRDREEGSPSHEDHEGKRHKSSGKHKRSSAGEEKKRSRHRERDV